MYLFLWLLTYIIFNSSLFTVVYSVSLSENSSIYLFFPPVDNFISPFSCWLFPVPDVGVYVWDVIYSRNEFAWAIVRMDLQLYLILQNFFPERFYHHQLFSLHLYFFLFHGGAPNQVVTRAEPQLCALYAEPCCAPRATAARRSWKGRTWGHALLTPTPVVLGWASSWGKVLEGAF